MLATQGHSAWAPLRIAVDDVSHLHRHMAGLVLHTKHKLAALQGISLFSAYSIR